MFVVNNKKCNNVNFFTKKGFRIINPEAFSITR